ncbi:unnamed protein product [marine sediment metagenome]|uniref:Uncharacterized protein n=1 Tax=marine sediment metagenome TaxID=412755 RepID=X1Q216_9ZZZZ
MGNFKWLAIFWCILRILWFLLVYFTLCIAWSVAKLLKRFKP